ncbi:hypothetical protein ANN_15096 [Periplaneta americana]|uniref:Mediator of RNA polymerase II transcription subunit 13 n=1 Tax=Periplaneta americana TaxID=6978 RepID=A0ABQ8SY45_PERAM|nr:hypothetical protein ANN_15096 [Periplaneta americana]
MLGAPGSSDGEQGSWESGLSYECRSLLFKALHNLIERCLLSRDFVRIGKWFVQPYDGTEKLIGKSTHFSFSFAFFVHGESTVCASMDVRMHPLVRNLTHQHLLQAQASSSGIPVILAPFGLAGTLTGQAYKTMDVQTKRQLDEWRQFYPIDTKFSSCDVGGEEVQLPPAVEVVVGGVKMRYPTCYVLVTDMDDPASTVRQGAVSPTGTAAAVMKSVGLPSSSAAVVTPPCSPCPQPISGGNRPPCSPPPYPSATSGHNPASMQHSPPPATRLPEHVWQDSTLNPTQHEVTAEQSEAASSQQPQAGQWEFADPTRKSMCSCSKVKAIGPSLTLYQIVTGDETWVRYVNAETKLQSMQWGHTHSPKKTTKCRQTLSTTKLMAAVFWDTKGILLVEFLERNATINAERYCNILTSLKRAIQNKRRDMLNPGVIFLHDNTRPHTACRTATKLQEFNWKVLDHPPCSPDFAPSDYHLFMHMKTWLGSKRLDDDEELKTSVVGWLQSQAAEFYDCGISKLVKRYDKCLNVTGNYVEK